MAEYNLIIIGGGGVGKSALTIQLVQNYFVEEYDPTIEDSYRRQVTIDDETCILDILDTAGQDEFSTFKYEYMRIGQGFVLAYSITSKSSFDEIGRLKEQYSGFKDSDKIPMVLVGNKSDLDDERQITTQEGSERAAGWKIPFFETSAKNRINVEEPFFELVRDIRRGNQQSKKTIKKIGKCQLF